MNRDNDNERPLPPDQDSPTAETDAAIRHDATAGSPDGAKPGVTDVQAYIGRQLRAVYDDVVKQPIPDRFLALMAQLDEKTAGR